MEHNLKSFLQYIFEIIEDAEQRRAADGLVCRACGLSYGEFKQSGKLGCASCYDAFRPQILHVLKNINNSAVYKGRIPAGQSKKYEQMALRRELAENKQNLRRAVDAEEFEEAAKYRDAITEITSRIGEEKGGNANV